MHPDASLLQSPAARHRGLLHACFEATAERCPQAIALDAGSVVLTYAELETRANQWAHVLRHQGIGPEDCVMLWLPRSIEAIVGLLAVLKAGAAYVPVDATTPPERAVFIAQDCQARALLTLRSMDIPTGLLGLRPPARADGAQTGLGAQVHYLDDPVNKPQDRVSPGVQDTNLCYLIYTSGTTGRPKGVEVEHRNVVSLLQAEAGLYEVGPGDRILQFASLAFDASVEEIWLAFMHGATLVVAPDLAAAGPDFARQATALGVTVLSCVPSFLAMQEDDIPSLRVLILGGEACPADLPQRWQRPGRALYNTYGPTEATVVATAARLEPSKPVTLGWPLAHCQVRLLDETLQPVPDGEVGEICIAGPAVTRGYRHRPEVQAAKFVSIDGARLYRTADLARRGPDGALHYLGRSDDQVKLRGYRIELGEIEALLLSCDGVQAAAVAVHAETQSLAAYVVPRRGLAIDRDSVAETLAARLPPYMVPAFLEEVSALPLTVAGKLHRAGLPAPHRVLRHERLRVAPASATERLVCDVWEQVLGVSDLSVTDHFFHDLGGHSLLATRVVVRLRDRPGFASLSVADLYAKPTVRALSECRQTDATPAPPRPTSRGASTWQYWICTAAQALSLLVVAGIYAWQWLGPYLAYGYLAVEDAPMAECLLAACLVFALTTPLLLGFAVVFKWLLLGRLQPGEHAVWGFYYWRFWFVRAVVRATATDSLAGTPMLNLYYRLMGARIGRDVFLGSGELATFDLLTVEDGATIGLDSIYDGASVHDGVLRLARVHVGAGCWVGHRAALGAGTRMEAGSGLGDLSMLADGKTVPAGQLWEGSPAAPVGAMPAVEPRSPWSLKTTVAQWLGVACVPFLVLLAVFPGLMLIIRLGHEDSGYWFLWQAPLVAGSFVVLLLFEVWAVKWLLVGHLPHGRFPLASGFYVRWWLFTQLMNLSLEVLGTLYTTLYLQPWLQALGARLGPRAEISTIRFIHPDLLEAGPECFLADEVSVGAPTIRHGWITVEPVHVGRRAFVGNSAVLPPGTTLGDNVLVGVLSKAPETVSDGTTWLGSPPLHLPGRPAHQGFDESQTYRPPRRLVLQRLAIEFVRVLLPSTSFVILAALIMNATDILQDRITVEDPGMAGVWLLLLPCLYTAAGVLSVLWTALLKWLLVGRYRVQERPLWSHFVWRTELVTGLYENLCVLFFLDLLRGTPFMAWALRLFGARIGRRCYIDSPWMSEFDLISVGDGAALNDNANVQTHLFEDRVMKMGTVDIGAHCTVGTGTTVLFDTRMEDGASLGDLSLLMKGDRLPAGTAWYGIPAQALRAG